MQYLAEQLEEYKKLGIYPFHMPGHKRKSIAFSEPFGIDITEIDGFDNLHHAEGILKEAQERAAELYGSKRCFYLVNGSTCGLLAAISAAVKKGDKVIAARSSHKAVYHALFLNELQTEYIYPESTGMGIQGHITPEQVQKAVCENPDAVAVLLTSPTYEGIVSDIGAIAKIAHAKDIPLIVDEAHGSHLGFGGGFPENAVKLGADAVIMSLHKTLPSFTQTALLHICSDRISEDEIERYLGIFETSSPSYFFMAGMDHCIRMLSENGNQLFSEYRRLLNKFYNETQDLKYLHVMNRSDFSENEAYDWDDSKLIIFSGSAGLTGNELYQKLLYKYKLQMEMVSGFYVLGMTSIMDEEAGFLSLSKALHEIDREAAANVGFLKFGGKENSRRFLRQLYEKKPRGMHIFQALQFPYKEISLEEAEGKMSAESISLYPPGIPLIVPGEIFTADFIQKIGECKKLGLQLEGFTDLSKNRIKIVYF